MKRPVFPILGPVLGPILGGFAFLALAAGSMTAVPQPAEAQSCTSIGSSVFCGARGSHNTVGRTIIFNNGPAGKRVGSFAVTGSPPRTANIIGARRSGLAQPRRFAGVGTSRSFAGATTMDSAVRRLRAEILALEATAQLQDLGLTPAQEAAQSSMSPALIRALTLAKAARAKAAAQTPAAN